ncbi:hypothetical protein C8R46DRAFT_1117040 [Mycena filopes]|nr:hypothetical protein C8R46DRAFT_1117040 [Mycena filopes]
MDGVARGAASTVVSTDAVVTLVESFLQERGFVRAGLLVRVHSRDAVIESVKFVRSTLVSVCPASTHLNEGHRRFPLFATNTFTSPVRRRDGIWSSSVDLHTSHAPIIACGCTQIKELFPPTEEPVVIYAVKRTTTGVDSVPRPGKVSKQSMYLDDPAWHPSTPQTLRGMAALLSSLYLLAHSVGQEGAGSEQRVLAHAYAVLRFPPAIRTRECRHFIPRLGWG